MDVENVTYRDVPGYPGYRVGNDGSIWSCRTKAGKTSDDWHQLKPVLKKKRSVSYYAVTLRNTRTEKAKAQVLIGYAVLWAFVGPRPDGMECCHEDGDTANNSASNLYWGTKADNEADKDRHGRRRVGEKNNKSKVTEKIVLNMRQRCAAGESASVLAAEYDLDKSTAADIVRGLTWKHVGGPITNIGERRPITMEQADEIRDLCKQGMAQWKAGEKYGISQGLVWQIVHGLAYSQAS